MASPKLAAKSLEKFSPKRFAKKKKEYTEDMSSVKDTKGRWRYSAVVAIDFGTTYSGYAYAFTDDPGTIHVMNQRQFRIRGNYSQQPTVLLLTEDGEFHSFGCEAQEFYRDIDERDSMKWLYFEKFKMELHSREHLHQEMELIAANGVSLPALTVFARALQFFKGCSLNELNELSSTPITNEDIQWVITVPAIWRPSARQFMRRAAIEGGLVSEDNPKQLLLSLEPEAASVYCHRIQLKECILPIEAIVYSASNGVPRYSLSCSSSSSTNSTCSPQHATCSPYHQQNSPSSYDSPPVTDISKPAAPLLPNVSYIVADCGGGTIDLTVHQVDDNGYLKELYKSTGGAWGSIGVDCQFEMLLVSIFGQQVIQEFIDRHPISWLELMKCFEAKKKAFNPQKSQASNIALPFAFIEHFRRRTGTTVEAAIFGYGDKRVQWSNQGMLRIQSPVMLQFFEPVVDTIVKHIDRILSRPDLATINLQYLFLVGGFAESTVLQQAICERFGSLLKVVIPHDMSLSILKGAVLFGLNPNLVCIRRSALTYGVACLHKYNPEVHPADKLVLKDGNEWCTQVFDKFVSSGQPLPQGYTVTRSYKLALSTLQSTVITFFASRNENVKYITDHGVKKIGELRLELPQTGYQRKREVKMTMTFGDTEISVSGIDSESGQTAFAQIDFLC